MATVDPGKPIAEIVQDREETRSVFLRHHVQLGRAATMTLTDLCAKCGIDQAALVGELERAIEESESFDLGGFEWNVRQRVVRISPNLARILGLTERTLTPRAILDRVHSGDRARVERLFAEAARAPRAFSFEYRVVRPDGATRLFATRVEPIDDDSPSFIGTSWDISHQRAHHDGHEASRSLLQSALEATVDGILVVDRSGYTATYNQRFLSLWGIPTEVAVEGSDETMIRSVLDQLENPRVFLANVQTLYANPERESFDVLRFKDGRVFERYSRPQRAKFAIIGRVWSFRDVTERERLLARAALLADASRLLGSLDAESALAAVARVALPLLGTACGIDLVADGGTRRALSYAIAPAAPGAPTIPKDVLEGRSSLYDVEGASHVAAPLGVKKRVIGAIAFSATPPRRHTRADLELVEQLAARIALALDNAHLFHELEQALRARDEFLSVAAHELRGPLSSIHLAVELLQRHDLDETVRQKALALVAREDRRIARFADEIVDIAAIRTAGLHYDDAEVDLSAIVQDVAARLTADSARSRAALEVDAPAPVVGTWDRYRLEQIGENLIGNALKFGLGNPIEVSVEPVDGDALLVVADRGLGVPPERRASIFEPFERAVPARHYGGLGLGLFIVRTIVARYGGSVRVETREGGGSRFSVRLPRTRPQ